MPKTDKMSNNIAKALLLVALVLITYQPSFHNGFIWDDDSHVTKNSALTSFEGLKRIWISRGATQQYYPMTFSSFWLEYQLFGPDPAVFHATNILLHAANALLVWLLLTALGVPLGWLGAALFALHPVNVESVAWISERKNVLSGFFALISMLALVHMFLPKVEGDNDTQPMEHYGIDRHPWLYSASFVTFVLALLAKSAVCMMPAVFLVIVWWKKGAVSLKTFVAAIPFFLVSLVAGINTTIFEKSFIGAQGPEWAFTIPERILIASRAVWFYAYKLLFPAKIAFIYPRWNIDSSDPAQYLFPIALLALLVVLWAARNRVGKGPLAAATSFILLLFPALGFINYYPMRFSFVADHFQYLASVSLIAAAVSGLYRVISNKDLRLRAASAILCAAVVLSLGVKSRFEQRKYKDKKALWQDTIAKNPGCWLAYNNLGCDFFNEGPIDTAEKYIARALLLKPDFPEAIYNMAKILLLKKQYNDAIKKYLYLLEKYPNASKKQIANIHFDLGYIYTRQKRFDEAEEEFKIAVEANPWAPEYYNEMGIMYNAQGKTAKAVYAFLNALGINPDYHEARLNLAKVLFAEGKVERALIHYDYLKLSKTAPPEILASVYNDLGVVAMRKGQDSEAMQHLSKAIELDPDLAKPYSNLAILLAKEGKTDEAIELFGKAIGIDPDDLDTRYRLAATLADIGDYKGSIKQYEYILERSQDADPKLLASVHNDMGSIFAAQENTALAMEHFQKALSKRPDFPEALYNLGVLEASTGRPDEGEKHIARALELKPDDIAAANSLVKIHCAAKRYEKAIEVLKTVLSKRPDASASISYNIACVYSIAGDTESSARWLEKVIGMGVNIGNLVETDDDLSNLRRSKHYAAIKAQLAKR